MSKLSHIATLAAIAMVCSARLAIATPAIEGAAPHVSASAGMIVAKAKKSEILNNTRSSAEASESHSDQSGTRDSAGAGRSSDSSGSHTESHNDSRSESHSESHSEGRSESHSEGHSESHGSDHH